MNKSSAILLSPICHLPIRSTWQATVASLGRIRGPRAFSALLALALAGVLSFLTCLRAGNTPAGTQAKDGVVLLLTNENI